jgi:protein FAM32A
MPASEYKGSGGALKLKGSSITKTKKKKKQKQPPTDLSSKEEPTTTLSPATSTEPKTFTSTLQKEISKDSDEEGDVEPSNIYTQSHTTTLSSRPSHATIKTAAELRADELRRKNLLERLRKEGVKTHKESVEEFNRGLARLSEHHDMPRIGPG